MAKCLVRKPFRAKFFFIFFSHYIVSIPKYPFSKGFLRVLGHSRRKIGSKKLDLIGIIYHNWERETEN
jgi:hypothetical protein